MVSKQQHKRLVIVRGGRQSLHYDWGEGDFDLINASYEENVKKSAQDKTVFIKGGKWDGLYRLFQNQPHLLDDYEMVWLPDDDIKTNAGDIDRLFDYHGQYRLALSQASLSADSYYSHFCVLRQPHFFMRYSNFVEIMMPCFSTSLLKTALPFFKDNPTGYFLDKIWHRLIDKPYLKTAIFDCLSMRHTRLVDKGSLKKTYPHSQAIKSLLPSRRNRRPLFYAGILADGRKINNRYHMAWRMACHMAQPSFNGEPTNHCNPYNHPNLPQYQTFHQIRYQLTNRLNLNPIPPLQPSSYLNRDPLAQNPLSSSPTRQ